MRCPKCGREAIDKVYIKGINSWSYGHAVNLYRGNTVTFKETEGCIVSVEELIASRDDTVEDLDEIVVDIEDDTGLLEGVKEESAKIQQRWEADPNRENDGL